MNQFNTDAIRQATLSDVEQLTDIYNEAIVQGGFTGDFSPVTLESRLSWFSDHSDEYRIYVYLEDEQIAGYVALSPYRKGREAFAKTAEISYYLATQFRGRGIGKQLIAYALENSQFEVVVAIILACNQRSIQLLNGFQFEECGRLVRAACINGEFIDHVYMSRQNMKP